MQAEWLKFKKYPHIGRPLTISKDRRWIESYVTNPKKIANHKFTPLLHRVLTQRKFRAEENAEKNISGKRHREYKGRKERHIYYPSHLDSIIYSYYNSILTRAYEAYLSDKAYASVAVAYRKIPKNDVGNNGNKCNIEFAADAFQFITNNKHRKLSIIVADVSSFFDNLNHRLLHEQWKKILNVEDLPVDHYKIYKSLVDYKYVNENELYNRFKHELIVERYKPNDTYSTELKHKKVKKIYNIRREKVVAYCCAKDFYKKATDLIRVDKPFNPAIRTEQGKLHKKGIPQGTPISATLANIYMLDFDARIYDEAAKPSRNAYYQRYSDDLIIVCDQKDEKFFYDLIRSEIEDKAHLEIQESKTHIYRYELGLDKTLSGGIKKDGVIQPNKQLEYLGFVFDGRKVRVKSAGFSKFYRNMKRSFRRGVHFAKMAHIPSDSLFEWRLYKRYTHLGAKRRLRWVADNTSPTGYKRTTTYDWGNFISYLNKANATMRVINQDDSISKQAKKIWKNFHLLKNNAKEEIGSHK